MAKRKKKKTETVQSKTNISVIVIGLFMILLSITGLYGSGIVGELIKNISIFMFGSWNFLFLIFTLGLGLYMVFRSGRPAFFASRLVGIYSLIFALLIIAHSSMIRANEIANNEIVLSHLFFTYPLTFPDFMSVQPFAFLITVATLVGNICPTTFDDLFAFFLTLRFSLTFAITLFVQ